MNKITVISRAEFLSKLHTLTLSSLALFFIAPLPSLANLTPASENEPFLDDSSRNNATSSLNNNGVSQILPDASGGQAVADLCLFGICAPVNLPSPLENVIEGAINRTVKNQLRSLFTEQIPISGSEHEFYDSVATLPGEAFAPQFLPLSSLPLDTLIPPGDYEIPAHFYCTKIYSFDGRGNRFALARLSGRMSDVLSALYDRASRNSEITTNDVQGLSWAIQTGISYNDLSTSQKALVDQLIPDYRDRMRASLIDQLTETTNRVSRLSGNRLPGVNQILNDLGSVGDVINSLLQARQQILQTSYSSQALAEEFAPQRDVFLQGGVEATPWSRTQENVYMRFIAPDGALDDGVIQVRLDNASGIATGILTQNITSSVGVPEASGSQAITAHHLPLDAEWIMDKLRSEPQWKDNLDDCPCTLDEARRLSSGDSPMFVESSLMFLAAEQDYHPGASHLFRSHASRVRAFTLKSGETIRPGQQCAYNARGELITNGPGAGTPDAYSSQHRPSWLTSLNLHLFWDTAPFGTLTNDLEPGWENQDGWRKYHEVWTPNPGRSVDQDGRSSACPVPWRREGNQV